MRIDIHSHLIVVSFLEHLQGRDALPTAVRDGDGFITRCAPGLSLPYRAPILTVDQLYVDTVGYGTAPLEYCYTQLGADRMLFGTDHPYAVPSLPQDLTDRLPCTETERTQILAGNAQRLLRLNAAAAGRALSAFMPNRNRVGR